MEAGKDEAHIPLHRDQRRGARRDLGRAPRARSRFRARSQWQLARSDVVARLLRSRRLRRLVDLAADVECMEGLGYMAELVNEFAPPHEANEKLYRMVAACLEALAAAPHTSKIVLRYFEIWILRLAGSFPDVSACAVCGTTLTPAQPVYLDFESAVRCANCSRGVGTRLLPTVQQVLINSQRLSPSDFASAYQSAFSQTDAEVGELTHRLIIRALERRPRAMVAPGRA